MPDAGFVPKTNLELLGKRIEEFRAYPPHAPFAGPFNLILQELTDLHKVVDPMTDQRKARISTMIREIVREEFTARDVHLTSCELNRIADKLALTLLS